MIGSRWEFKIKRTPGGAVEKYMGRLVARASVRYLGYTLYLMCVMGKQGICRRCAGIRVELSFLCNALSTFSTDNLNIYPLFRMLCNIM